MTIPSIYINLEDDVSKIVARIKKTRAQSLILVCPKRCFLFNDSINLRLLKKQTDLLKKEVFILTMDEKGQMYAKEAGFDLKFLPKVSRGSGFSDIKAVGEKTPELRASVETENPIVHKVKELGNITKFLTNPKSILEEPEEEKPLSRSVHSAVPKVLVEDNIFPIAAEDNFKTQHKKTSHKALLGLVAISLIVVLLVVFVVLPKAEVLVYAKTENITRDPEISISINISAPDPARLVMPATKVEQEMEVNNSFQSQGKKEVGNKAGGTVRIYNFTKSSINLKASTTSLIVGSKTYVLSQDAMGIRPTGYTNAKTKEVDPKTLSAPVEIIAAEGGEASNLPAGVRIEITNKVFGSNPQFLYAKSESAINGGTTRYLSIISPEDISVAQSALTDQLMQKVRDSIKGQNLILPDKFFTLEIENFTTDKPAGTESPSFEATLKAKVTGLGFNLTDLKKLIVDRISQTLPDNKTLLEPKDEEFSYKNKSLDLNNGVAVLNAHFQGQDVTKIDLGNISSQLSGKSKQQANDIIRAKAEVDKVEITLAPSWQKSFPWFSGKIDVKVVNGGN